MTIDPSISIVVDDGVETVMINIDKEAKLENQFI